MIENKIINHTYQKYCTRRQFVKDVITGLGTIAVGSFTLQVLTSCSTSNLTGPSNGNDEISLTVDISLAENQALNVIGGTIALTSNDLDDAGIFVIRKSESEVIAFSRECTHQGCTTVTLFLGIMQPAPVMVHNSISPVRLLMVLQAGRLKNMMPLYPVILSPFPKSDIKISYGKVYI